MQIIVLGMHRSGTSCVTRLLNMAGAYFGPQSISTGANEENPKGFWERRDVRRVCDALLHGADADWWQVADFAPDRIPAEVKDRASEEFRTILGELDAHRPWVIKEPRLCLLLPVLRPKLEAPVCVHVHRHPVEVARSLRTRNGFSLGFGLALWEFYSLSAINASRGLPRLLVSYGDVIEDPIAAVRRLLDQLAGLGVSGLHLPDEDEVSDFVDETLHRERSDLGCVEEHLTRPQTELAAAFEDGRVLDLADLPPLSSGAREFMAEFRDDPAIPDKRRRDVDDLRQALDDLRREFDRARLNARKSRAHARELQEAHAHAKMRISSLERELNLIVHSKRYAAGAALAEVYNRVVPGFARPAALSAARNLYFMSRNVSANLRYAASTRHRHRQSKQPGDDHDHPPSPTPREGSFPPVAVARPKLEQRSIDIIVCVHNSLEDTKRCLASVNNTRLSRHRVILVDDGSDVETKTFLEQHVATHSGDLLIRHDTAQGYTKAANAALRVATGDYVTLLNSDTIVTPDWALKLLECGESAEDIGIVGPLSNAASWQSIPECLGDGGDWAVNSLPEGYEVDHMAQLVELESDRAFPRVPLVNGFCMAIKRRALEAVGRLDEEAFPEAFGEENDFCFRAADAGFACAIATHAYVYHAKSKSYAHGRRRDLTRKGDDALRRKYSAGRIADAVERMRTDESLARMRSRVAEFVDGSGPNRSKDDGFSVLFVLPVKAAGGGAHSVIQEITGLRRLGVNAKAAVPAKYKASYTLNYESEYRIDDLLLPYREKKDLIDAAARFDVAIATTYESVDLIRDIVGLHPDLLPAYYVQDYEPFFFESGTANRSLAEISYTAVEHMLLFAKTQWLCGTVERLHDVRVHKVSPSLDDELFSPPAAPHRTGPVTVAAMVRVQTPLRAPHRTMRVLRKLARAYGDAVQIHTFGTNPDDLARSGLTPDFPVENHGLLSRQSVADLLRRADVFADFSDYQAFGRTGLEAMACGNAVLLPQAGGAHEYARDRENARLVNTESDDECYEALREVVDDAGLRAVLQANGPRTASRYSVHRAALSELILLKSAWKRRRGSPRASRPETPVREWSTSSSSTAPRGTIIICIRDAPEDVVACLDAVQRHTNLFRHQVILVDDGSDAKTARIVRDYVTTLRSEWIRNERARGYTRAANQGIVASSGDFVVLLNSDTIVTAGWLDRLVACAFSAPDIACVGPLSNAASWQSIPSLTDAEGHWCVNQLPTGIDPSAYADAVARRSPTLYPRVPLVNGFCFLITRAAIDRLGPLDEGSFPFGYGEEDDFCIRALDAGMHHRIADDCYVHHSKSKSFTAQRRRQIVERSKEAIARKHTRERLHALVDSMRANESLLRSRTCATLAGRELSTPTSGGSVARPLRIGWIKPHLGTVGGVRRAIEMANGLVAMGHSVALITPDGAPSNWLPITADVLSPSQIGDGDLDVLIVSDPDVVEYFDRFDVKLRINYHLAAYMHYRKRGSRLKRYYLPTPGVLHVANSKWTAEQVERHTEIRVAATFPGGVDRQCFRPICVTPRFDVVCYGSRRAHKGTETIMAAAKGLDVLRLAPLGAPQRNLARHICSGKVFVSACRHEGFNFCPLEAMACGVPVVMTDDGGSREYARDGENAIVVQTRSQQVIRQSIEKLMVDTSLRVRLIERGLETAWEFSWDKVTSQFSDFITERLQGTEAPLIHQASHR
ncbi:MAG: glycosyltransferase [Planctomycetota bacterium]|jgi:GT2 family glycosyltransferase/glycosyltransferase involved in cell wall biosynthesis